MLYHLLSPFHDVHPIFNVFRYLTFRAMFAFIFSFLLVSLVMPWFIRKMRALGGQPIRDDGPKEHFSKKGTPTMGGVVVIGAVILSGLLFCDLTNPYVGATLLVLSAYSYLGFVDDWRKVTKQDSKGISERTKIFWQVFIAVLAAIWLMHRGFSTELTVPYIKVATVTLGLLFIPFVILVLVGTSNAVNLTDGLDGLAIGPIMTVAATYGLLAYLAGNKIYSDYLFIFPNPLAGEVCIILAAIVAGGLGFLWYNTHPAQVFMGDVGALGLGGVLGFIAVLIKQELLLVIAGGIFVVEALSVLIQRYSYKLRKKRVFKMAPIHHHFELMGWPEPKIIVRFWIVSICLALLALTSLKLR